jgi:hypothetical protein
MGMNQGKGDIFWCDILEQVGNCGRALAARLVAGKRHLWVEMEAEIVCALCPLFFLFFPSELGSQEGGQGRWRKGGGELWTGCLGERRVNDFENAARSLLSQI